MTSTKGCLAAQPSSTLHGGPLPRVGADPLPTPGPDPDCPMRLKPDTLAMTVCLALLTALGPLSTDMYLPSLPAIARELGATTAQAQATLSVFLIGFAAGQFVYGPVSDKVGRKPMMLAGLALFLAASLACTLAPTIETLTLARFFQALGASGPIVLGRAVVRDLYEGARAGRELSRMGTVMGIVPAVAPVLGGFLADWAGWRSTFALTVVLGAALGGVVLWLLPETLRARVGGAAVVPVDPARLPLAPGASGLPGLRGALLAHLCRPVRLHLRLVLRASGRLRLGEVAFGLLLRPHRRGLRRGHARRAAARRPPRARPHHRRGRGPDGARGRGHAGPGPGGRALVPRDHRAHDDLHGWRRPRPAADDRLRHDAVRRAGRGRLLAARHLPDELRGPGRARLSARRSEGRRFPSPWRSPPSASTALALFRGSAAIRRA